MRTVTVVLGLLAATPAVAADQFDLVCSAKTETQHYRLDLVKNEWCFGKCENVQKISSVTSGMITLADHQPAFRGDYTAYNQINRISGEWRWHSYNPRYTSTMDITGSCISAPFSGIASSSAAKF